MQCDLLQHLSLILGVQMGGRLRETHAGPVQCGGEDAALGDFYGCLVEQGPRWPRWPRLWDLGYHGVAAEITLTSAGIMRYHLETS